MKNFSFVAVVYMTLLVNVPVFGQTGAMHKLSDIYIRDPYILVDTRTSTYFLYRTSSVTTNDGNVLGGVEVFKSKDMENWEGPVRVFTVPEDNWITGCGRMVDRL